MPSDTPSHPEPWHNSQKNGVLVVDDNADLASGLARVLQAEGYSVFQATGGRQAVEIAKTYHPRVALMDIVMPDLSGIDACRRIKQLCPEAKVILMTGYSELENQACGAGAEALLLKPVDHVKLLELLEGFGIGA